MFATELLREDHQQVKRLFDELRNTVGDAKKEVFERLKKALEAHSKVEEEIFYVAVREASDDSKSLIDRAQAEHRDIDDLLAQADKLDIDDDGYDEQIAELEQDVLEHVKMEEARIFTEAERSIDDAELERLAEDMRSLKIDLMEGRAVSKETGAGAGLGI